MCVLSPGKFPDQTFAFSGRESCTLIITKTMGCLVLDFQGLSQKTCIYIYLYLCIFIISLSLYIYIHIFIYIYIFVHIYIYNSYYMYIICVCFPFFLPAFRISRRQIRFFTSHEAMQLDLEAANG